MKKDKEMQYQILKKMTYAQKLSAALDLIYSARELKRAALKAKYKNESDEEINKRLAEIFRRATT